MAVRTVIIERETEKYLQDAVDRIPRLEDVYGALEWRLARNPEIGEQIPNWNPPKYLVKSID